MTRSPKVAMVLTALAAALVVLSVLAVTVHATDANDRTPALGSLQAGSGSVTGIVKDKDNRSVKGAQVVLSQGSHQIAATITGSDGTFNFLEIEGSYNLTINYTGYEIYTKAVSIVAGQTLDLGFVMLIPVPNYYWVLMDIIMIVGALVIFFVVGKRVRKL